MKTFKNTVIENNNSLSNVWFVQGEEAPAEFGDWVEVLEVEIEMMGAEHLYRQAGVDYFGKL